MNWLMLKQAILDNDKEKFTLLVEENAGILEQRDAESMDTILHLATRCGRAELVAEILGLRPVMVGAENARGETPLHEAGRLGHEKILMMLLETDPWVASKLNCHEQSALYLACCYGHLKAASVFLNQPWLQEVGDGENANFLHVAASQGHIAIVRKILVTHPYSGQRVDKNGYTPLHHSCSRGHPEITAMLLKHYPEQAFQFCTSGYAPLHLAAVNGCSKVLKELLSAASTSFGLVTRMGETVFHLTVKFDRFDAFVYLDQVFDNRSLFYQPDKNGDTCLHLAISGGHDKIAEYILKEGGEQYIDINYNFTTPSESKSRSISVSSFNNEHISHSNIPRLGQLSDQETSSRRKKTRMCHYKHQSEKSRKGLIKLYRQQHRGRHEIYREALHNARETITLVAVLIATITYTGGINPPGGVYQDGPLRGTAVAARRAAFKVFSVCNNVALFASLCIVIVLVSIIPFRRKPLMMMLMVAHKAMWVAVGFMATAYVAASVVLMPPSQGHVMDWTVTSLLSISAGTLGSVFVGLGFMLTRHHFKKMRYRKEVTYSTGKDNDLKADDDGQSINSDMDISIILGYHAY